MNIFIKIYFSLINHSLQIIKNKTKCISFNLCEMMEKEFQGLDSLESPVLKISSRLEADI